MLSISVGMTKCDMVLINDWEEKDCEESVSLCSERVEDFRSLVESILKGGRLQIQMTQYWIELLRGWCETKQLTTKYNKKTKW